MGKRRIKAHIRKTCRRCRALLVNEPEAGVVCPKCGWRRISWTYKDKQPETDEEREAKT